MGTRRLAAPLAACWLAAASASAASEGFRPVTDRSDFLALVSGKALTRFGVSLTVRPDGTIEGRAFGFPVRGDWRWQEGYFCRAMRAGRAEIPDDCQQVLRNGDTLRFIADRGRGEFADLRLR
jgi:hypothetical protein